MSYRENKARARTVNNDPTMTEQSQARDTDINVIVGRFLKTGMAPGAPQEPQFGDFSNLPTDLRGFIEVANTLAEKRQALPDKLRDMPMDELLALTPDELTNILTPPTEPSAPTGEPK